MIRHITLASTTADLTLNEKHALTTELQDFRVALSSTLIALTTVPNPDPALLKWVRQQIKDLS